MSDELFATIRGRRHYSPGCRCARCVAFDAALDELVALVGTLQQERADAVEFARSTQHDLSVTADRAEAAEAALAEANEKLRAIGLAVVDAAMEDGEFWIVYSENHLSPGALAYWGPYPSRNAARESGLASDDTYAIVRIPAGGDTKEPA